jgi:N-acetylglucosamine-6-phosphate deacetylase
MIVLCPDSLYTPLEEIRNAVVFVEDGVISKVTSRERQEIPQQAQIVDYGAEFPDCILAPGFVDIHIHGGAGVDAMRASANDLPRLNRFLATRGVTGYFPTTVGARMDEICAALEQLADAIGPQDAMGNGVQKTSFAGDEARPLGIHLEGPFLSHKRPGVHPLENLLDPTPELFERLWQAAHGQIRMMTIAPELPGAMEVIAEAARRGVCVSLGHSDALMKIARAAVEAGARHATHTFNAMRPLDHREPGIVGETLTNEQLSADVIADGIHLAPEIVKLFLHAKGVERSVLITDATAATGMPDGTYQLGPIQVEVRNGRCTLPGQPDKLAGSVLTMDRAVRNAKQFAGWSLRNAVRAATLNPARVAGLGQAGEVRAGVEANFTLLTPDGTVLKTMIRGRAS